MPVKVWKSGREMMVERTPKGTFVKGYPKPAHEFRKSQIVEADKMMRSRSTGKKPIEKYISRGQVQEIYDNDIFKMSQAEEHLFNRNMVLPLDKEVKEAERKVIEAQGIANSQDIIDETLTNEYLRYLWIQKLDSHDSVIYVPIGDTGLPLFKNVDKYLGE